MTRTATLLLLLPITTFVACKSAGEDDLVAKAYGNYLRMSDIEGLVNSDMSPDDSAAVVNNYVNQWIQQQVVLRKAESNVNSDFQNELQNYKNSLIIYEYERLVIEQLLDTNITDEEVRTYYQNHRDDFLLKTSIIRAIYAKLPNDSPGTQRMRKLMARNSLDDDDMLEVQKIATMYGQDYSLDEEQWMPFSKLQSFMPMAVGNEVDFLRKTHYVVVNDSKYTYLAHILEYKAADDVSPLEYEYEHIRTVLLNRRKIDIIKNMQRDLLKKAELDNEIERYR